MSAIFDLFMCSALKIIFFFYLSEQEAAFRKVVQATMVRDRQHGPVVELNRIQVHQQIQFTHTVHSLNVFYSHSCYRFFQHAR